MNCPKCKKPFKEVLSKKNVLVDVCTGCKGLWFDQGEINYFVKSNAIKKDLEDKGLNFKKPSSFECPDCCKETLETGKIPHTNITIEKCTSCHGLYFDKGELKRLLKYDIEVPIPGPKKVKKFLNPTILFKRLPALPSLGFASLVVLGSLYAFLIAFSIFLTESGYLHPYYSFAIPIGFVIFQFAFGPFFLDLSLRWVGSLKWYEIDDLPPHLTQFIQDLCKKHCMPFPKFGIIDDSSPNAFTYGRTPSSARLVISKGILELLEPEEVEAVVAHEFGHIVHWDFLFMTLAQLVPILFYQMFRFLRRSRKGKGAAYTFAAAMIAYVFYLISEYFVLYLSRIREYWADRYSGAITGNPNDLSRALMKIVFGINAHHKEYSKEEKNTKEARKSIQALGICNISQNEVYGIKAAQSKMEGANDKELSKEVLKWDLWNPWATFYELSSTHPLIAKRVNALSTQAKFMKIDPEIVFDLKQPESYWDEFFVDIFFKFLPIIGFILGSFIDPIFIGQFLENSDYSQHIPIGFQAAIIGMAIGMFLKLRFSYPSNFGGKISISSLHKKVKVSAIRGIPVKINGRVLGRGVPGYVFSEDFVMKDSTGLIFLDYQQPLALFNFIFSILSSKKYIRSEVTVEGWYRRAPVPYVEIKTIQSENGHKSKCYTYHARFILIFAVVVAGMLIKTSYTPWEVIVEFGNNVFASLFVEK